MSVTARMYVVSVQRHAYNREALTVELGAATRGEENKAWAAATPSANLKMVVLNSGAGGVFLEAFEAGKDLHLTFDVAPDPSPPVE